MAFYDAFKDAIALAQKADNIELYKQLLDLSAQALDLQAENAKLKEENTELKKKKDVEGQIIRHRDPYITLKDEKRPLFLRHLQANCQKAENLRHIWGGFGRRMLLREHDSLQLLCTRI